MICFLLFLFAHTVQAQHFVFHLYSGQILSGKVIQTSSSCALIQTDGEYKPLHKGTISRIYPSHLEKIKNTISEEDAVIITESEMNDIFIAQNYRMSEPFPSQRVAYTAIISSSLPFFLQRERKIAMGYVLFELTMTSISLWLLQKQQRGVFLSGMITMGAVRYWVGSTTYKTLHQNDVYYNQIQTFFEKYCRSE